MEDKKTKSNMEVNFSINFKLTVEEASLLEYVISHYSSNGLIKNLYNNMNKTQNNIYISDLKKLFNRILNEIPPEIDKIRSAEQEIKETLKKF